MSLPTVRHMMFVTVVVSWIAFAHPAMATPFFFSTGTPDGLIATLSRTASTAKLAIGASYVSVVAPTAFEIYYAHDSRARVPEMG